MRDPITNTLPETMSHTEKARLVRQKWQEIASDPNHPKHRPYHMNDRDIIAEMNNDYRQVYGAGVLVINPETVEIPLTLGGK